MCTYNASYSRGICMENKLIFVCYTGVRLPLTLYCFCQGFRYKTLYNSTFHSKIAEHLSFECDDNLIMHWQLDCTLFKSIS